MTFWPFLTTIIITSLFLIIFGGLLNRLEVYITEKFSAATSTRRWFTIWVFVYILWITMHVQLMGKVWWYTNDIDFITLTGLFSAVPFWVENSLKHGQAKFQETLLQLLATNSLMLDKLMELIKVVEKKIDQADAEAEAMFVLVEKIVEKLEEHNDR